MNSKRQWPLSDRVTLWLLLTLPCMYDGAVPRGLQYKEGVLKSEQMSPRSATGILQRNHSIGFLSQVSLSRSEMSQDMNTSRELKIPPGLIAGVIIIIAVLSFLGFINWWHGTHTMEGTISSHLAYSTEESALPTPEEAPIPGITPGKRRRSSLSVLEPSIKHDMMEESGGRVNMTYFDLLANDGELDVYTVFGVSMDTDPYGSTVRHLLPVMVANFALQVVLPILLAVYQVRQFKPYSTNDDLMFRSIGFLLFGYSVWHMYHGALDRCRSVLLDYGLTHKISWYAMVPMLIGEAANAFVAVSMVFTLFSIFCFSTRPTELIINCVAMNFVITVDNNFVTVEMKEETLKMLKTSSETWVEELEPSVWRVCRHVSMFVCQICRVVGILGFGSIMACVFLVAHQKEMCNTMRSIEPVPFCLGLPDLPGT